MRPEEPTWQPVTTLPLLTKMVAEQLADSRVQLALISRVPEGGWQLEGDRAGDTRCGPLDPEFTQPGQPLDP